MDWKVLIPFVGYFVLVMLIGLFAVRYASKGLREFFIGGRRTHRFVVAISAVVSGRSTWILIGFTGLAYCVGVSAMWFALGYILVEFFLFLYYAPFIRHYSEEHDCITLADLFDVRYQEINGSLRVIVSVVLLIFMIAYVSAQLVAGGKAFAIFFDIEPYVGIVITAFIVLGYISLGGFRAISFTDVLQALFMLVMVVIIPIIGVNIAGGWDVIYSELAILPQLDTQTYLPIPDSKGDMLHPLTLGFLGFIGAIGIGLGSPGSPHIIVRYMSMKDPDQFKWTAIFSTVFNLILTGGAVLVGLVGRAYFAEIESLDNDAENLYFKLAFKVMHPIWGGLLLASIFAAIMSTTDSQLLIGSSTLVRDIYEKRIVRGRKKLDPKDMAFLGRLAILGLVIISSLIGFFVKDHIFWFMLFAWAGLGAALGPATILSLFWSKTTKLGVIAGIITGVVAVFVWKTSKTLVTYELIPGFLLSFGIIIVVSLAERALKK